MALYSNQPLTEMSTRNISWGWKRPVSRADKLLLSCGDCPEIREPQLPGILWACPGLLQGLLYLYPFTTKSSPADSSIRHFRHNTVSDTHFVSICRVLIFRSPDVSELPDDAVSCLKFLHMKHPLWCNTQMYNYVLCLYTCSCSCTMTWWWTYT